MLLGLSSVTAKMLCAVTVDLAPNCRTSHRRPPPGRAMSYEHTLAITRHRYLTQDMADFETKVAGSSQLDWLQAVARSHTKFVTDLVSMYANAIRNGLSG
jgi:hypothetical protein